MVVPEFVVPLAAWISLGVGGLFMAWLAPKAFGFLAEAVADKTVEKLENRLAPMWQADLEDALQPIYRDLKTHEDGSKWPNGSTNLPDSMREVYRRMDEIQRWVVGPPQDREEWDDPEGAPI
jgi:hypothetical protein